MITYATIKNYWIRVYFNDVLVGEFNKDVDGFFYFWPDPRTRGCSWSSHFLLSIGEELNRLNKPLEEQLARELTPCPS